MQTNAHSAAVLESAQSHRITPYRQQANAGVLCNPAPRKSPLDPFTNCIKIRKTLGEVVMDFHIDAGSRLPIYQQLAQQLREAVARGDLQPEAKLPSVRQLSRELVANPNTIARAYTELEREGLLASRPGLGIFV